MAKQKLGLYPALAVLLMSGSALADGKRELAEVTAHIAPVLRDCDVAFQELMEAMSGEPDPSNVKSVTSFVIIECEAAEDAVKDAGRVTSAPLAVKKKVDVWLFAIKDVAWRRAAMSRVADRYAESEQASDLKVFQELAAKEISVRSAMMELQAEAEKSVNENPKPLPPGKRLPDGVARQFRSFVAQTRGLLDGCDHPFKNLTAAVEAGERAKLARLAPQIMSKCSAVEAQLEEVAVPKSLPDEVRGWLDSWVSPLATLASSRSDAARAAGFFAESGRSSDMTAYRNYLDKSVEAGRKAEDSLIEAQRLAGL